MSLWTVCPTPLLTFHCTHTLTSSPRSIESLFWVWKESSAAHFSQMPSSILAKSRAGGRDAMVLVRIRTGYFISQPERNTIWYGFLLVSYSILGNSRNLLSCVSHWSRARVCEWRWPIHGIPNTWDSLFLFYSWNNTFEENTQETKIPCIGIQYKVKK